MKIITAAAAGICFGVRDALSALVQIEDPHSVAIYGELVHNEVVLYQLETRGFQTIDEDRRAATPDAPQIVITAHGISDTRRRQFIDAGKSLIDTTCPLVTRVHRAAQQFAVEGAFVVILGRADHVEVLGITGDLKDFAVVSTVREVRSYPYPRIGIICQTTFPCDEAQTIRRQVEVCNPSAQIEWVDTICQPTKDRQQAVAELLDHVEAMVVVGGLHSHNTKRLVETCQRRGLPTFHVQNASEIDPRWFTGIQTVGLTAGTSTLPETLDLVYERLASIAGGEFAQCR